MFRRLSKDQTAPVVMDEVHVLNATEQTQLKRIKHTAIFRACLIGTLTAIICGFSMIVADWILGPVSEEATYWDARWHYAIMIVLVTFATVIEIILLYWNALIAVHRMAVAAGLCMFADDGEPNAVLNALVGAALELPNSREETLFVQPGREVSRFWILLVSVLYRLKVTATYYIIKAIVQRFLGRVLVRWAIELIAIPIYAFWDALITFWVLRQARVCVMGPSAVRRFSQQLQAENPNLSPACRTGLLCSVGSVVARNSHLHPNIELFLRELIAMYGMPDETKIDDSGNLLNLIAELNAEEQQVVLKTLTFSLIIDGHASIWEKRLLQSCLRKCGLPTKLTQLSRILKQFKCGEPIQL